MEEEEKWVECPDFPNYMVSSFGRVFSVGSDHLMSINFTQFGNAKINLMSEDKDKYTRSVALLVARSFLEPFDDTCDTVIVKNMNQSDLRASNLEWRPFWFSWGYTNQFKHHPPIHYQNLRVFDVTHGINYTNIIEAAIDQGLLFQDIWYSTYSNEPVYPTGSIFTVKR